MTKKELLAKLAALGNLTEEQRNDVTCSLVGHSRIQTHCFGYYYCGRCSTQVGDTLASVYPGANEAVVVGHDCAVCRKNFATLDWRSRLFALDPFPVKEAA